MSNVTVLDGLGNQVQVPITPIGQTSSANSISVVMANDHTNQNPVGSGSIATNQISVNTSITLLANARTGGSGTGRIAITIYNSGTDSIFVGNSSANSTTGLILGASDSLTLNMTSAIYGIANSLTQKISILETF